MRVRKTKALTLNNASAIIMEVVWAGGWSATKGKQWKGGSLELESRNADLPTAEPTLR